MQRFHVDLHPAPDLGAELLIGVELLLQRGGVPAPVLGLAGKGVAGVRAAERAHFCALNRPQRADSAAAQGFF